MTSRMTSDADAPHDASSLALPRELVVLIGEYTDYETRRSCVLAHRALAPVMEPYLAQDWHMPAAGRPFDGDAKTRALLKYKPRLNVLRLAVDAASDPTGAGWAAELAAALSRPRMPPRIRVDVEARANDAALLALMDVLAGWWPAAGCGLPVWLRCTVRRFSTALRVLEHCSCPSGWVDASASLHVHECVALADGDAARAQLLLERWRAGGRRRYVDALRLRPLHNAYASVDERPLLETAAAAALRELLTGCCRTLDVWINNTPTVLSAVASVVSVTDYVFDCPATDAMLAHLAANERLEVLELAHWDARTALNAGEAYVSALRGGRARLRLVGDALVDAALPGLLAATRAPVRVPICLRAATLPEAFLARRAVEALGAAPGQRDGVCVEYVAFALARRLQDVPLSELARRFALEASPASLRFFGLVPT